MSNYSFTYDRYDNLEQLSEQEQVLVLAAQEISQNAYAPYSKFKVGCTVQLDDGKIIKGTNIENAAYPVGLCAERAVLSHTKSNYPNAIVRRMAVSYSSKKTMDKIIFPCGMCRQFILEYQLTNSRPIELVLHAPNGGVIIIKNAADLLPFGFTRDLL